VLGHAAHLAGLIEVEHELAIEDLPSLVGV
jgi:hypothetical protein